MIVAVEGLSAAGKTTWCRRHARRFVAEYAPTGDAPDGGDQDAQAKYWAQVNSDRWLAAERFERGDGVAVCDTDPLKLHYSWCLSMIGAAPRSRFERELRYVREAFDAGALGVADVILVSLPTPEALRDRYDGDPGRRRRNFELHARLREPLTAWYQAVDSLAPGRVVWTLPPDGLPRPLPPPRGYRTSGQLLDALVAGLPVTL